MEIHKMEITMIHKHNIERKSLKKKISKGMYSMLLLILVPVFAVGCLRLYSQNSISNLYNTVCALYNPIYSPYAETGSIIFTGVVEGKIEDIELPIISSEIECLQDGTIKAKVIECIMVKSVADGVVESIEDLDGGKVVTILYPNQIHVKYINLDVVGVNVGNIIKKGKEIGTAEIGECVEFKIYIADTQVKGINIVDNKIDGKTKNNG